MKMNNNFNEYKFYHDLVINAVRITQILKDNGWLFIDEGYNEIKMVINKNTNEEQKFTDNLEFIGWLNKKYIEFLG
jgi:hypothetical protein